MTTYTDVDVTIDSVGVYSDASATVLVETLTFVNIATGTYQANAELTASLYTAGTLYYLKITYTPSGDVQRSQIFPFYYFPSAQAGGTANLSGTSCEGTYLQDPQLTLHLGRGGFRVADFENATAADRDRYVHRFPLPDARAAADVHLVVSNARAGEPFALEYLSIYGTLGDQRSTIPSPDPIDIPVPFGRGAEGGYRGSLPSRAHLLRRSRNMAVDGDLPRRRRGYRIIDNPDTSLSEGYVRRIIADRRDGTLKVGYQVGPKIFEEGSGTAVHSGLTDPYALDGNKIPQWIYSKGVYVQVAGAASDIVIIAHDGSSLVVKNIMDHAGQPTVGVSGSGHTISAGTWYIRIRGYDEDTGTYSGPSDILATAVSVSVTGTGEKIQVTPASLPTRWSHWQVQLAMTTDTPAQYNIHRSAVDSGSSPITGLTADGLIPRAATTAFFEVEDASGSRFPYRGVEGVTLYQHAKLPTDIAHATMFQGRAFYASAEDDYLIFSEVGNVEHGYWDPDDPRQGFNTVDGESLVDTALSPCTALAATQDQILFFMRTGIVVGEGSFALDLNESTALVRGRDARFRVLQENNLGAVCPDVLSQDNFLYFWSTEGPAMYVAGSARALDADAIRPDWECRDPVFEHRYHIGYLPRARSVLFSYVTKDTPVSGQPNVILPWSRDKSQWAPPWDMMTTSMVLHRLEVSSVAQGVHLLAGVPQGAAIAQLGYGDGDGKTGSETDTEDLLSTSDTSTTVTVSGKAWSTNEWRGCSIILTDRTTGWRYYRVVKSNTADTITWDGSLDDSGAGWIVNLGGIRGMVHMMVAAPGRTFAVQSVTGHTLCLLSVEL